MARRAGGSRNKQGHEVREARAKEYKQAGARTPSNKLAPPIDSRSARGLGCPANMSQHVASFCSFAERVSGAGSDSAKSIALCFALRDDRQLRRFFNSGFRLLRMCKGCSTSCKLDIAVGKTDTKQGKTVGIDRNVKKSALFGFLRQTSFVILSRIEPEGA